MKHECLTAGLVAHSLLFSIGSDNKFGKMARAKLSNAFKLKFKYDKQYNKDYESMIDLADRAFKNSWSELEDGVEISIPKTVYFMVVQNPELFKPYKINIKHLEALNRASNVDGLGMNSTMVARNIIKHLDMLHKEYND